MRHQLEAVPEEPIARGLCRHYWVIESPKGPTSRGVCKLCGAEKEFNNYGAASWQEVDISPLIGPLRLPDIEPDKEWDDYHSRIGVLDA